MLSSQSSISKEVGSCGFVSCLFDEVRVREVQIRQGIQSGVIEDVLRIQSGQSGESESGEGEEWRVYVKIVRLG